MMVARGLLKYGLVLFVGAWMFALGVVVGRGTSPVTFDTQSFQEHLRVIVGEIPKPPPETEKVGLGFYEALNKPVPQDVHGLSLPAEPEPGVGSEIAAVKTPSAEKPAVPEDDAEIPVKHSRKSATLKPKTEKEPPVPQAAADKAVPAKPPAAVERNLLQLSGPYTIQVAAYRDVKDADTHMSRLEKKGISAYKVKAETRDGKTWYRVRTGTYKTYQAAQTELKRLNQAKVDGMILKKDDE